MQDVEIFAGFETDSATGSDGDLGPGARVAAHAGFARFDGKYAEAAQLDAIVGSQGFLHGFKDSVHGGLRLGSRKAGAIDDTLNQVLLNQTDRPFLRRTACAASEPVCSEVNGRRGAFRLSMPGGNRRAYAPGPLAAKRSLIEAFSLRAHDR